MTKRVQKFLFWLPRILCILSIVFLSLFTLDAFSEGYGVWKSILSFLIHLIPSFVLLAVLIVSWYREWVGGALFTFAGIFYIIMMWGQFPWIFYFVLSGPLLLVGITFFMNWFYKKSIPEN
jgi:hypothetical protein